MIHLPKYIARFDIDRTDYYDALRVFAHANGVSWKLKLLEAWGANATSGVLSELRFDYAYADLLMCRFAFEEGGAPNRQFMSVRSETVTLQSAGVAVSVYRVVDGSPWVDIDSSPKHDGCSPAVERWTDGAARMFVQLNDTTIYDREDARCGLDSIGMSNERFAGSRGFAHTVTHGLQVMIQRTDKGTPHVTVDTMYHQSEADRVEHHGDGIRPIIGLAIDNRVLYDGHRETPALVSSATLGEQA